jgi:hypothetical protein
MTNYSTNTNQKSFSRCKKCSGFFYSFASPVVTSRRTPSKLQQKRTDIGQLGQKWAFFVCLT